MVRVIVFALIALGWWLAAPDRFTAAARTATGTGLKAAGTGARAHWTGGRDGRKAVRTDRRDRWHAKGGGWRKLLGIEHGAVVTGKAVKGAGKLAGAAVKPIPGAVREGWRLGQAWHEAKVGDRPIPLALDLPWHGRRVVITERPSDQAQDADLDPPWWRTPVPAPVPPGTGQDSPQDSGTAVEDSPETGAQDTPGQLEGQSPTTSRGRDFPPYFAPGDTLRDGNGKAWTIRGVRPQIDADTYDLVDADGAPGYVDIPRPDRWNSITAQEDPTDPPAGTDPDATTPTDTPGGTVPPISTELRTHVAVQDFAQQIDRLSEASDFIVVAEQAREVGAKSRAGGFGGEMDLAVDSLEAAAKRFAEDVDILRAQAHELAKTSLSVQGS